MLCACVSAAQDGRRLDAAAAKALSHRSADLLGLARLAGRHRVTPMLAACVADPELRQRLPADFVLYLEFVHTENRRRNAALRLQVRDIATCLNRIGIEPVLLKGAVRLVDGLYRDPGWRFMRDLDLLVARARLPDAIAQLAAAGYRPTPRAAGWPAHHKHLPPLHRHGDAAVVEIHCELLPEHQELCPARGVFARSRLLELEGARVRIPDTVDQLAQLIGHDRFDRYLRLSGMFLLRSMFEAALLCREAGTADQLLGRAADAQMARWARVWLILGAQLFPEQVHLRADAALSERLQARTLLAMERFDQTGRWRRLVGFARLRGGKLRNSRAEREYLASHLLSPAYGRRSMQRLRRLWASQ